MDDDVGNVGTCAPDPLLDLARACVSVGESAVPLEAKREMSDDTVRCVQKAEPPRLGACDLANDATHELALRRVIGETASFPGLGQRLEMSLDCIRLRDGVGDRPFDLV